MKLKPTEPSVVEATIGQWSDFVAMNAHEIIYDPTPEEVDRILRESEIR